jgi:hypothetical protein
MNDPGDSVEVAAAG